MSINIQATGMELTEAMKEYAIEKMEASKKYFDNIQKIDIDIGMRSNHHNKGKIYYAEVNVFIPKQIIRVVKDAEDLYKAIDKVKDHLKVEFEKIKGKMRHKDKQYIRDQKEYQI
ncbi:MAG: ribosome-associated translation inhibitor RaiA [Candidatus Magasanikbacteria bacterium]|nr:ribosome-associated translation inhibitor RaiA [Candidatus Magasanikbacteria bacterium]NCS71661.1 ribosome-associated translation inhibitor RaiA [Candidatus Magasanikbacteria bacterium]